MKYYIKYNLLGGSKIKLYHGSPYKLDILSPSKPRGDNDFNSQIGIYMTDNNKEAMLYSIARDKEKFNKGFGIKNNYLILREDLFPSKYKLNEIGYLYEYDADPSEINYNPFNLHEYIIKKDIIPNKITEIKTVDIIDNIKYVLREDFYKIFE
jgi:hypothetical protein